MKITEFDLKKPVITTTYVAKNNAPIVFVSIDSEFDIQVFSEEGADMEKAIVVSLENIFQIEPSIKDLPDFAEGDKFIRDIKASQWKKI